MGEKGTSEAQLSPCADSRTSLGAVRGKITREGQAPGPRDLREPGDHANEKLFENANDNPPVLRPPVAARIVGNRVVLAK